MRDLESINEFNKGVELYKNKEYNNAINIFSKYINQWGTQVLEGRDAIYYRGISFLNLSNFGNAILDFDKLIESGKIKSDFPNRYGGYKHNVYRLYLIFYTRGLCYSNNEPKKL